MQKLSMDTLHRKSVEEFKSSEKLPITVVLDNIRSMHNVGSVFRTSDAFLIENIILCGYTPRPPHRDINKTALGATETVNWKYVDTTESAVLDLKAKGYKIYAIEQVDESIPLEALQVKEGEKIALILGNEVEGVDENVLQLCDSDIEIPQFGTKHSLNVSVAAGIVLWEFAKNFISKFSDK